MKAFVILNVVKNLINRLYLSFLRFFVVSLLRMTKEYCFLRNTQKLAIVIKSKNEKIVADGVLDVPYKQSSPPLGGKF